MVGGDDDVMRDAVSFDGDATFATASNIGCSPQCLERVALLATAGGDVMGFVGNAHVIVQAAGYDFLGQSRAVVGDNHLITFHCD